MKRICFMKLLPSDTWLNISSKIIASNRISVIEYVYYILIDTLKLHNQNTVWIHNAMEFLFSYMQHENYKVFKIFQLLCLCNICLTSPYYHLQDYSWMLESSKFFLPFILYSIFLVYDNLYFISYKTFVFSWNNFLH